MTDKRRDFLLRFAAVALATGGAGCDISRLRIGAVYGPPPTMVEDEIGYFHSMIGKTVYFDPDRISLNEPAKAMLDKQISWLKEMTRYAITLEGHTDDQCAREYCLPLSERQARVVQDYMVGHGIAPERIKVVGYGKERPAMTGDTEAVRSRNRRVDTVLHER